jgi:hypothetical protein
MANNFSLDAIWAPNPFAAVSSIVVSSDSVFVGGFLGGFAGGDATSIFGGPLFFAPLSKGNGAWQSGL